MRNKILALLLSCSMALTALAGCGSGGSSQAESSAAETVSAEESPAEADSGAADSGTEADTVVITDHAGRQVEVPAQINRVVVTDILPMASVLTVFLGSADKIVGIHPSSMSAAESGLLGELFPEILEADTSFMAGGDLNVEQLLNLDPDVVLVNASSTELISAIENAGLTAVGISPSKWDYDILETYDQWIALLSQMFPESSKSEEISAYSKEVYGLVQERVKDIPEEEKKSILFLYNYDDNQIITSGKHFFGQYWADAIGGRNAAEEVEAENSNAVISMEQVYQWDPDVVLITNFTTAQPDDLYNNTIGGNDWSSVKAVTDGQVYKMPLGTYRSYTPSADTPVTFLWMAKTVYPELFEDIDITAEVRDYYQELYGVTLTDEQIDRMYNPASAGGVTY
ncbi:MAG TPA: ABC transporter substrate-binding protein [Candidatus Merdivicinus intestinavium]|nr:ABC transporter substrate-binding protein [Candidatus Merdivicinus intestinavium]